MSKGSKSLTDQQRRIVRALQGDIPLTPMPYRQIADALGIPEESLIDAIAQMKAQGLLRRFGATLRHQKVGFVANAMSAWVVPEERVEEVGRLLAALPQVTHCYERPPRGDLPFNLYAMIHGKERAECRRIAEEVANLTGIHDFVLLFSSRESKKSSMAFF
jgi:siroheme decarboxylase